MHPTETETSTRESVRTETASHSPAVSVVVPAYLTAPYIGEALASVFAQTFTDFEVVVVNDGSPDTPELERALEPYRERIAYIRQENRGPAAARNAGIRSARGRYVAFLDSDDLWLPRYLEQQMRVLESDPALDLIYTDALFFGDSLLAGKTYMGLYPSNGEVTLESLLRFDVAVITSCVVARRETLLAAGLFDERFFYSEDFDLWARLAHRRARFAYQTEVLARHRFHASSLTANRARLFEGQLEVYRKLRQTLEMSPGEREALEMQLARSEADLALEQGKRRLLEGEYSEAAEALSRANDFYRSSKLRAVLLALRAAPGLLRRAYRLRHAFWLRRIRATERGAS
ncbi:MAG TPA: glycosyltransferase family A protein [Pyrinomonadaceae bacterium]|jgi:glycosyltransferase involved in cell wall biosynthesis